MVPVVGLEPTRCHHQRILNPFAQGLPRLRLHTLANPTPDLQEYAGMGQRFSFRTHALPRAELPNKRDRRYEARRARTSIEQSA